MLVLLGAGLVGLLLLNTLSAQEAIQLHTLQLSGVGSSDQVSELAAEVDRLSAPESIAARAGALGLVPAGDPVFVRPDGRLVGAVPSDVPVPDGPPRDGILVGGTPIPAPAPAPAPRVTRATPAPSVTGSAGAASATDSPRAAPSSTGKANARPSPGPSARSSAAPTATAAPAGAHR